MIQKMSSFSFLMKRRIQKMLNYYCIRLQELGVMEVKKKKIEKLQLRQFKTPEYKKVADYFRIICKRIKKSNSKKTKHNFSASLMKKLEIYEKNKRRDLGEDIRGNFINQGLITYDFYLMMINSADSIDIINENNSGKWMKMIRYTEAWFLTFLNAKLKFVHFTLILSNMRWY